ncbi:DUF2798 domain-containing protein [Undibacterium sp. TJN19]|uniref:DUF2798 domain-containing protein n=1 Tax=Undibacterium sp. TJN19 TaxID=3413055 RepID=UPI003BF1ED0C
MQHSSVYTGARTEVVHAPRSATVSRQPRSVAGSRSLASMLPTILTTGVISLVATAVLRLLWMGFNNDFFGAWMEAWLTVWPIAFPVAYISKPLVDQLTRKLSKPLASANGHAGSGLNVADVMHANEQATLKSGLKRTPIILPIVHR